MRVLAITNMYPPHHYGGYEQLCADVVGHLAGRGHDVGVLTSDWRIGGVAGDEVPAVDRSLRMYWRDHEILDPGPIGRTRIERHNQRELRRVLDDFRPDVVSVWAMGCLSMGMLHTVAHRGIPMVSVVCDDWLIYGPMVDGWHRALRRRPLLDRIASRLAGVPPARHDIGPLATHCFISETTEAATLTAAPYELPDRTLVYAGIETADFPGSPLPERPFRWRLLHVGRIDHRKGIDVAVRALVHLPEEATLTVLGRGDDRHGAELRSLAGDLGVADRVSFGAVPRGELAARWADADVCVFPPRWSEPLGLVPVEAMACGTPVVSTATGGSAEYLLDGTTCLRFPLDDDVGLAAAVTRLAGDGALRRHLAANGRRVAAELTMERWVDLLEAWHRHAVDPARPRPPRRPRIADLFDLDG